MKFNERLKALREEKGLTQAQLSQSSGICSRMIQKYECGAGKPRIDAAEKLAAALGTSVSELLGESETLAAQADDKYGPKGARQARKLMEEVTGLFAGGEMAEEDMDVMMKAISDAYWIAKEKNRKFVPKSRRKKN